MVHYSNLGIPQILPLTSTSKFNMAATAAIVPLYINIIQPNIRRGTSAAWRSFGFVTPAISSAVPNAVRFLMRQQIFITHDVRQMHVYRQKSPATHHMNIFITRPFTHGP